MASAYLGFGSNVGDKERNIRNAYALIMGQDIAVCETSGLYKTEPVGIVNQDWFLNSAARVETERSPWSLWEALLAVEESLGRVRTMKWGPRVIDVDILFYEDRIVEDRTLVIPHPHLHERGFVLIPLCEIAPQLSHPRLRRTITQLMASVKDGARVEKWLGA